MAAVPMMQAFTAAAVRKQRRVSSAAAAPLAGTDEQRDGPSESEAPLASSHRGMVRCVRWGRKLENGFGAQACTPLVKTLMDGEGP